MGSSLFGGKQQSPQMNLPNAVGALMSMVRGQNPQTLLNNLCMKDPQIRDFVKSCEGKTPEQIAAQCGVDYNFLRSLIK